MAAVTKNHKLRNSILNENCYCGSCDRGFATEEDYQSHCDEHVVCGRDGCTVSAHPKVIEKHVIMQHKSGLYKRIAKDSPEDLQKWIEERKRNYPSKENVQKNKEKLEEMEKRGERIHKENERFGKRKRESTSNRTSNAGKCDQDKTRCKKPKMSKPRKKFVFEEEPEREDSWRGSLPHFPGTALFPEVPDVDDGDSSDGERIIDVKKSKNEFSDSEWEGDDISETPNSSINLLPSSLLAISSYNSDPESDLEGGVSDIEPVHKSEIDDNHASLQISSLEKQNFTVEIQVNDDNDEPPDEVKIEKVPVSSRTENQTSVEQELECSNDIPKEESTQNVNTKVDKKSEKEKRVRKRNRNNKKVENKPLATKERYTPRKRLTLLEKLLGPEIRHERNVILQCVRFAVENNFFDN